MLRKNRLPENVAKALKMVNKMADRPEGKSPMGRRFVIQAKIFINFLRRDYKAVESLLKEGRRKEGKKIMLKLPFCQMFRIRLLNLLPTLMVCFDFVADYLDKTERDLDEIDEVLSSETVRNVVSRAGPPYFLNRIRDFLDSKPRSGH